MKTRVENFSSFFDAITIPLIFFPVGVIFIIHGDYTPPDARSMLSNSRKCDGLRQSDTFCFR